MKRALAEASLIMKPEGYAEGVLPSLKPSNGDGDFTFTRGSNLSATRVNAEGLIEKGRENLLLQSNQFDTTWAGNNALAISEYADRNGGTNAWLLREQGGNIQHYIRQSSGLYSGIGTFSFYAKKKDYDWIQFARSGDGGDYANFNISNGTLGNVSGASIIDRKIESVGNGWYRCSVTYSFNSNSFVGIALIRSDVSTRYEVYQGDNTSGTYIQDSQVESGLVATDYIETRATTAKAGVLENTPRLDYSGGATEPSLLLEPQRTNQLENSEYFGSWNNTSYPVTITSNAATSPDGNTNATLITPTSGNSRHATRDTNVVAVAGTTYTLSAFFKKAGSRYVVLGDSGDNLWRLVTADLDEGTITNETNATGTIEPYENDWYRITCTFTRNNPPTIQMFLGASPNDTNITAPSFDNTSLTTYVYGAQVEASSSYPTSYIPTYGTSQTRSYDDCDLLDLVSKDIITDATQWTIMFEVDGFSTEYNSVDGQWFAGQDSTLDVYMRPNSTTDTYAKFYWRKDSKYIGGNLGKKMIARLSDGIGTTFVDGVLDGSSSITGDYSGIGFNKSSNPAAAGYVKQLLIFPTALTDSECIALTKLD